MKDVASLLHKVATFYRRLYDGGQNVFNNWRLFGATSSLVFNKSCLKLAPTNFTAFFLAELTGPSQKLKKKKKKNTCKVFTEFHCTVSVMVSFLFLCFCFLLGLYRRISFIIIYTGEKIKPQYEHKIFALRTIIITRDIL